MKTIRTKLFKIGGIWQVGFIHLNRDDIRAMNGLRGFRYNEDMHMWHISFHVSTIKYLNSRFEGRFQFLEDPGERSSAPELPEEKKTYTARMTIEKSRDRLILKHSYHTGLYKQLKELEGSHYDLNYRYWVLSVIAHYSEVKEMLGKMGFSVTVHHADNDAIKNTDSEKDRPTQLSDKAVRLMKQFERELFIRNRSQRTVKAYLSVLKQFLYAFIEINPQDITHAQIRDYLYDQVKDKEYSFSSINIQISAIRSFYKYVYDIDYQQIKIPNPKMSKDLPKVISQEDIQRMIVRTSNLKHRAIISTLYSTAIRRQELINLRISDIDLQNRHARISGKGNKERVVFLSSSLISILESYKKTFTPAEYLFEGPHGGPYSSSSIANIIRHAANRAGISQHVTPHMLRHSFATHMLAAGVSPIHLQKILGHTNIKTTLIYTHLTDNDLSTLPNPLDNMNF